MTDRTFILVAAILFCTIVSVKGTHKCVWVRGALQCHRDTSKQLNVEVRVYDRDGFGVFKALDPDDLMGVTFTESDGTFQLDGCGDDFNWLPGLQNVPDPYVRIHHYCNSERGETIELPEFYTFVPETYDLGIIVLDSKKQPNATVSFPTSTKFGGIRSSKASKEVSVSIFDSREREQGRTTGPSSKHVLTHPDQSNWEFPVELASGSQESGGNERSKEKNERLLNWTKRKQQEKEAEVVEED